MLQRVAQQRPQQREREVVHAVVAEVLEALGHRALARAGEAGDERQADAGRVWSVFTLVPRRSPRGQVAAVLRRRSISSSSERANSCAEKCPCSLSTWLRAAISTRIATLRPSRHRHADVGAGHVEDAVHRLLEPQPVVRLSGLPGLELDHQVDRLALAHRGQAEQVLDVDDADAAQLHVMAQRLRAVADQLVVGIAPDADAVVADQAVAAGDEVERRLALPHSAAPDQQHAQPIDVEQHGVHGGRGDQVLLEEVADALDDDRGEPRRAQHRHLLLAAGLEEVGQRLEALGDDEDRDRQRGDAGGSAHARSPPSSVRR